MHDVAGLQHLERHPTSSGDSAHTKPVLLYDTSLIQIKTAINNNDKSGSVMCRDVL